MLDSSFGSRNIVIDEVSCGNNDRAQLLECSHKEEGNDGFSCRNGGDAGVRCREEELRVKSVSAATVDTSYYYTKRTVTISWELHNTSSHRPSSFTVTCSNSQHHTALYMINGTTMQISIGDLLSASYRCCVSATYYGNYVTEGRCTSINTETLPSHLFTTSASIGSEKVTSNDINMQATIIGRVLGSIIDHHLTAVVGTLWRSTAVFVMFKKQDPQNVSTNKTILSFSCILLILTMFTIGLYASIGKYLMAITQ